MIHYDEELQQQISDFLSKKSVCTILPFLLFFPKQNITLEHFIMIHKIERVKNYLFTMNFLSKKLLIK
jgi:hypothetical protein